MLQHLDMVKCADKVQRFARGTIIAQAGDNAASQMYILIKGSAVAYLNNQKVAAKYNAGDFFGEMALFGEKAPDCTVIAMENVIVLPIDRKQAGQFFAEQPEATFALIKKLCERIPAVAMDEPAPTPGAAKSGAAKPAAAKSGAPAAPPAAETANSPLFPPEHTHHQLDIVSGDNEFLFMKNYTCPICGNAFKAQTVKSSKLVAERTDPDLRMHYADIEPLHFDIVICPKCWYSAMTEMFKDGVSAKLQFEQVVKDYKDKLPLLLDTERDSFTVFAGYYLALACAVKCFRNHDAILGKLWLKLSRLYDDCADEKMSAYAVNEALKGYMGAYEKSNTPAKQNQQLCYLIGELSMRTGDFNTARKFFFSAKMDKSGSPVLTRHAEDRIEYLRELTMQAEKEQGPEQEQE